jgi:hypothetical protein
MEAKDVATQKRTLSDLEINSDHIQGILSSTNGNISITPSNEVTPPSNKANTNNIITIGTPPQNFTIGNVSKSKPKPKNIKTIPSKSIPKKTKSKR